MNLILYSLPLFIALIIVEWLVSFFLKRPVFRLNDSISDLSCGILDRLLALFWAAGAFNIYYYLFKEFHFFESFKEQSILNWTLLFFLVDLIYYWFHRCAHSINFLWATHVVHHSSEEFNLTVALRQGPLQGMFSLFFYLPLALLGFNPAMFFVVKMINTILQFWFHTRLIKSLGPLEWILNTPSHHRLHHAKDSQYLDCNFAGVLIIWDKLFGTFKREEFEPHYGITSEIKSFNPLWAIFSPWIVMASRMLAAPGLQGLLVPLAPPGWRYRDEQLPAPQNIEKRYDPPLSGAKKIYFGAHFLVILLLTITFLMKEAALSGLDRIFLTLALSYLLFVLGHYLDDQKIWPLEGLRLGILGLVFYLLI